VPRRRPAAAPARPLSRPARAAYRTVRGTAGGTTPPLRRACLPLWRAPPRLGDQPRRAAASFFPPVAGRTSGRGRPLAGRPWRNVGAPATPPTRAPWRTYRTPSTHKRGSFVTERICAGARSRPLGRRCGPTTRLHTKCRLERHRRAGRPRLGATPTHCTARPPIAGAVARGVELNREERAHEGGPLTSPCTPAHGKAGGASHQAAPPPVDLSRVTRAVGVSVV